MLRFVLIASLALLASCSDPAKEAEDRYSITLNNGTYAAQCQAAREVASEYLKQKNAQAYERWSGRAENACFLASEPNAPPP